MINFLNELGNFKQKKIITFLIFTLCKMSVNCEAMQSSLPFTTFDIYLSVTLCWCFYLNVQFLIRNSNRRGNNFKMFFLFHTLAYITLIWLSWLGKCDINFYEIFSSLLENIAATLQLTNCCICAIIIFPPQLINFGIT